MNTKAFEKTNEIINFYVKEQKNIKEISNKLSLPMSTIRRLLIKNNITIRTAKETLSLVKYKLGNGRKVGDFKHTEKTKKKISQTKLEKNYGKGIRTNNKGYYEYTKKPLVGKLVHRHLMELHLGRKLKSYEQVHHKDENKLNNSIDNLEVLTISEHLKLHASKCELQRNSKGQIKGKDKIL